MRTSVSLVGILIAAWIVMCCSGCIVFFREEPVAGKDPDADKFVKVKDVRGRKLILQDGSEVEIAGLDTTGQNEFRKKDFDRTIRKFLNDGGLLLHKDFDRTIRESLKGGGLLLYDEGECARAVVSVPYCRYSLMFEWPAISLFPRKVKVPPTRKDLAEMLIVSGRARAKPDEVQSEELRRAYIEAQAAAKKNRLGIWASPEALLILAVQRGDTTEVDSLLSAGVDVNTRGHKRGSDDYSPTALHIAVQHGYRKMVELLISKGADVNAGPAKWTVLHQAVYLACGIGQTGQDIVELLLAAKADVAAADKTRRLIDNHAVSSCPLDVIEWLLDRGAKLDIPKNGPSLLGRAVGYGNNRFASRLLEMGVNPDSSEYYGFPLLIWAVAQWRLEIAELMLTKGADVNCRDSKGHTPLYYAKKKKYKQMEDLLLRYGAK